MSVFDVSIFNNLFKNASPKSDHDEWMESILSELDDYEATYAPPPNEPYPGFADQIKSTDEEVRQLAVMLLKQIDVSDSAVFTNLIDAYEYWEPEIIGAIDLNDIGTLQFFNNIQSLVLYKNKVKSKQNEPNISDGREYPLYMHDFSNSMRKY